jgi:NAD(P)-dependent dehydrogenase (short-subunit alcohol dehydrogenase family)
MAAARVDVGDRVAIVTGSSKGIGFAIAKAFVSKGMKVVLTARHDEGLRRAASALGAAAHVHAVRADVRKAADAERIVAEAVKRFGGLDILVNNAGVGRFANVADLSLDEWQEVIETNLSGVFHCCRAAIPEMKRRGGGYIVNISSLAGKNAFAGAAAYCASKSGLNAFSEALMQEVRHDNIRVSYVMPGSVSTGFGDHGIGGEADWKVAPEEVAEVVMDLVTLNPRSLASRVELRPSRPPRKG